MDVESAPLVPNRPQLDPDQHAPPYASAVHELREAGAPWEQLAWPRPQRDQRPAMPEQHEPQPAAAEPLPHIAAVDEEQLEQALGPGAPDPERTRIEPPHDPTADVEDDDDADA